MKFGMQFARIAIAMATLFSGSTLMAATLNLPYSAGYVHTECSDTQQGGVRLDKNARQGDSCWVDVPLPIESGHLIQEVAVYYGTEGAQSDLHSYLGFKDLHASAINNTFAAAELFYFDSTTNVPQAGMAVGRLMTESLGGATYPDAFEMVPDYAYFVRVRLRKGSEFFGVRVTYE